MLLEREPLNTFMAVSFFNENIKYNVIMIIMLIIIIIVIMIHKEIELSYSICILYHPLGTQRKQAKIQNVPVESANATGEGPRERGNLRHSERGEYFE